MEAEAGAVLEPSRSRLEDEGVAHGGIGGEHIRVVLVSPTLCGLAENQDGRLIEGVVGLQRVVVPQATSLTSHEQGKDGR